jgi:hypothetical protein
MKHNITSERFLAAAKAKPDPVACGTEFSLDVTNSITVASCSTFTDAEQQKMLNGILFRWRKDAESVCAQNGEKCPAASAVGFKQKSTSCVKGSDGSNVWTLIATIAGKCTPI